ncbi:hypothetical protein Hanom_Chr02g00100011 [Helianthus anomalus]
MSYAINRKDHHNAYSNLKSKMPFSSLRFGYFCDFRPKVCFSASGSKRFENSSFSSNSLLHFSLLSQGYFRT